MMNLWVELFLPTFAKIKDCIKKQQLGVASFTAQIQLRSPVVYLIVTGVNAQREDVPCQLFTTVRTYKDTMGVTVLGNDIPCQGINQFGDASKCQVEYNENPEALKAICDTIPNCKGFVIQTFSPTIMDPRDPSKTIKGITTFKAAANTTVPQPQFLTLNTVYAVQ